jgi:zinc protease
MLGGGRSSRLFKKLVYEQQIAQNVSASQNSLILGSIFQIDATARPGHTAEELEKAIDQELASLRATAPSQAEIEQARNTIETAIIGGLERLGGFGGVADRLNMYNHYLGTPDYLEKDVLRYRGVTPATAQAFAKQYLTPTTRVVVHAVPGQPAAASQGPPPSASAPAAEGEGESINVDEPWRNDPPRAGPPRPLQLATPASATLPNGLTLILNERRGLPIVAASLVVKTGSDANPTDKSGLANFVAAMLDEGTATRSALQLADETARLGATLTTGSSMDATVISARALAKNFASTLDLVADVTLKPSFPAEEIERQRASRLAQLVQQRDSPGQVATQIASLALYGPRHPYGYTELGTEASVKTMGRQDMTDFWSRNFVPNNAALVVAGDISMTELRALAEKAFATWQRGAPVQPALRDPETTSARVVIVDKPGSPQTELRVAWIGPPRSTPDFLPLQVMNNELGGLFSSRINMNLREQHGYSYGARSGFAFRRNGGPFVIAAGVRTDATAPAVSEIFKEVQGIIAQPVTAEQLRKSKDALANSIPAAFETSQGAVNSFSNIFVYSLGLDYYTRYAQQVNAVTAAQALDVAKKYIVPGRLVIIAVGDRAAIEGDLRKLNLGPVEVRDTEGRPVS